MEDRELIEKSREGDEEAFGMLVKKYEKKVFNLICSLTRNPDLADDLAQDVFIKAYLALNKFQHRSEFGTWLYRIAVNHTKDFLRKKSSMPHVSFDTIEQTTILQEDETLKREAEQSEEQRRQTVFKALETLPEKHRMIINLRDVQGFSYEEIARILSVRPGTVDSRLHRARKLLRKKLEPLLASL